MDDSVINRLCGPLLVFGASVLFFAIAWLMMGPDQQVMATVLKTAAQLAGGVGLVLSMRVLWLAMRRTGMLHSGG
jgi:hypothetical protein